jgi:peptidoglycan/LPS O-acetylase OafA/YrhL
MKIEKAMEAAIRVSDTSPEQSRTRLHHLDWLRVLAIVSVFLYHCDRFFTFSGWHVVNATRSLASTIHITFFGQWMMPFFFVLSGASIFYALKQRSAGQFLKERSLRLMLPLVTLGWFILGPPQIWLDRLTNRKFSGTFWEFYPEYFSGADQFGGNFAWHGMHMWYLLYLFMLSLFWLPLMLPLKTSGVSLLARTATLFERPWGLLLPTVPLAAMDVFVDTADIGFMRGTGGWAFFSYLFFLPVGYIYFCTPKMQESVWRFTWIALGLAAAMSTFDLVRLYVWQPEVAYGSWAYYGVMLMRSARALCWIIAFLGLGKRFLNFSNRFVRYSNEAVLPFYILHQFVIIMVGHYAVIQWHLSIGAKFVLIVILSFVGIMIPYEFVIRRLNPLRVLFGMRALQRGAGRSMDG